jgi:opacity protein-like surface antigen
MKKSLLLVSAVAAAALAAPAFAQSGPVGSVGVSYSNSTVDFGPFDGDADSYAIDGVVAVDAFAGWTATFAGSVAHNDDANDTGVAGTAHLTRLAGSDLRFGGFVGAADAGDETAWSFGGEVQKYLANATLTGAVAYTTADDIDVDAWTVSGDAAFYVTPNLRLNAGLGYSKVDIVGTDADLWTYGVGAEYEISNTPFSVAAGFNRGDIEDVTIDTWTIGLRYSFGGGLQARDRAGAALPGAGVAGLLGAL